MLAGLIFSVVEANVTYTLIVVGLLYMLYFLAFSDSCAVAPGRRLPRLLAAIGTWPFCI